MKPDHEPTPNESEECVAICRTIGYTATLAFVATIVAANWLVTNLGIVAVGFGLMAPAGVFVAGRAFTLRDIAQCHALSPPDVHERAVRWPCGHTRDLPPLRPGSH